MLFRSDIQESIEELRYYREALFVPQPGPSSADLREIAARHGCHPLRGVATYEDVYKLTYVRGPSGIIVMFAEELKKS